LAGKGGSGRGLSANLETNIHPQANVPASPSVVKKNSHANTRAILPGFFGPLIPTKFGDGES
jgi:hypothetical protein